MDTWRKLLIRALDHLAGVGVSRDEWSLGGGTMLMLRHGHRHSRDIDIFLEDVQYLSYLSPRLNELTAAAIKGYSEAANSLRLEYAEGEIDYLVAAPVFPRVDDERRNVDGIEGPIRAMRDVEILGKKFHYRAAGFAGRDLYDFAAVTRYRPELLSDGGLRQIAYDKRDALEASIASPRCRASYELVDRPRLNIPFDDAKAALESWLAGEHRQ